ncbi:hypothetical protein bwei_1743 [Bacillus mycoides]|nr:hypothetical protein bwei_1743 [Bacillus mycoides]KZD45011.1 hypothetical protein B4083_0550 [Bacillus cereus]
MQQYFDQTLFEIYIRGLLAKFAPESVMANYIISIHNQNIGMISLTIQSIL